MFAAPDEPFALSNTVSDKQAQATVSGRVDNLLAGTLLVRVLDQFDNPISNVPIVATALPGVPGAESQIVNQSVVIGPQERAQCVDLFPDRSCGLPMVSAVSQICLLYTSDAADE